MKIEENIAKYSKILIKLVTVAPHKLVSLNVHFDIWEAIYIYEKEVVIVRNFLYLKTNLESNPTIILPIF